MVVMDMLNEVLLQYGSIVAAYIAGWLLYFGGLLSWQRIRKIYAALILIFICISPLFLYGDSSLLALLMYGSLVVSNVIAFFALYFMPYQRTQYYRKTIRNLKRISLFVVVAGLLEFCIVSLGVSNRVQLYVLLVIAMVCALCLLVIAATRVFSWSFVPVPHKAKFDSQPSVTLAIPARNETHALTQNLRKALASKYEKLEILVVDDCSHDKTAQIIRSFAHDGVRFISGSDPGDDWLGKNNAYDALLKEASGEYVVYSGTDVELHDTAIKALIELMQAKNLDMVSVAPQFNRLDVLTSFLQPLRHFWLIASPTPALSSLWVVRKEAIIKVGALSVVKDSLFPETYFAKKFSRIKTYEFALSNQALQVHTRKKLSSQFETSIRLLYPQFGALWFNSVFVALALISLFIIPLGVNFLLPLPFEFVIINTITISSWLVAYGFLMKHINPKTWLFVVLTLPFKVVNEVILIVISALMYETNQVVWKERNICEPVINSNI